MRRNAREFCLRFAYHYQLPEIAEENQLKISESELMNKIKEFSETIDIETSKEDEIFSLSIISGVLKNYHEVEEILKKYVKGSLSRINKTDYTLLLLSLYELGIYKKTPTKVVINEAIELSKKYGNSESPSFVNAVLDKYSKNELK